MQKTLVLVKPDGLARGLVGEIIAKFERKGLKLVGLKMIEMTKELAGKHYGAHKGKPFYEGLIDYITSLPVVAMAWEGPGAITVVRAAMGATDPAAAEAGTIRGDFAIDVSNNLVHGSDSPESAAKELEIFFEESEILSWERPQEKYITGM